MKCLSAEEGSKTLGEPSYTMPNILVYMVFPCTLLTCIYKQYKLTNHYCLAKELDPQIIKTWRRN